MVSGSIEWDVNIPNLNLPSWKIGMNNLVTKSPLQSLKDDKVLMNLQVDELTLQKIKLSQIKGNINIKIVPPEIEIEKLDGNLWNGIFTMKGVFKGKENIMTGNLTGEYSRVDLSQFTEEVQPPWVKLSGIGDGNFAMDINLSDGELVEGDFTLTCPNGLTINRDVLLQLILYLQNVSIVQKQLERLLGKEDPKPFTKGELTLGYKNNQATVSLFLSTPNIDLAPIFYINADWKTLWSLMFTPSGVQIEIK